MDDNYEDYRDFNDMDYGTALNILKGTPQDQGNFYPKPQQSAQMQQPIIPNMDYNSALALLKPSGGNQDVPHGTSQKEQSQFGGGLGDFLMHGLAGTATSGRNLLNTFQKGGDSVGLNKIMGKVPGVKNISRGENDKNFDFYKALGLNENIADKLGVGLLDYAPYGGGAAKSLAGAGKGVPAIGNFLAKNPKTAMLAENMLGGAAYGGANDGLKGALMGGLVTAPLASGAGAALGGLTNLAAKKYAQTAIPEFINKSTESIRNKIGSSDFVKMLEDRYLSQNAGNAKNWKKTDKISSQLDKNLMAQKQKNPDFYNIKGKSPSSSEAEILNSSGQRPGAQMIGKDFQNLPANPREISGYDAAGAPIFKNYDFGVSLKEPQLTKNIKEGYGKKNQVAGGHYDSAGAPILESKINFNNSPYVSYIDKFKDKINKMEPAKAQEYQQAIMLANKAKELAPQSFSGLISARKNINQDLKKYLESQNIRAMDNQSKQFLSGLKNNLKEDTLKANKANIGEENFNKFKNTWEDANKSHQSLQEYYKSLNPAGVVKPMRSTREAYEAIKGGAPMDMALLDKYMPKPAQTGIQGFKQLEKLYGSKEAAQNAAKAFLFRRPAEQGANTVDSAAIYSKLSPAQRKYIFGNSKEGQMLESVNKTRVDFGREPERNFWKKGGHGVLSYGLPFALGAAGASASGLPWNESLGIGAGLSGLSKGAGMLAGKTVTPALVNSARNLAKKPISAPISRALNTLMQSRGGNQ